MKTLQSLAVGVLFAMFGLIMLKVERDNKQRFTQANQAFMRASIRAEVALAIERQDYVDAARLSFPSLADKTSPLYHACIARYGDLVAENSPMLTRPDWPLLVAQEEAERLGVSPIITLK